MSDDLISKNTLLEKLKDFRMTITGSANAMALTVMDETKKSIMRIIEEQPIAYDVDEVGGLEDCEMKSKQQSCRFCHRFMGKNHDESHCVVDGWENDKVKTVSEEQCEKCERFDSKFIKYPLTIQGIDNGEIDTSGLECECGTLCEISPCSKKYEGKSYIGIYLGDFPIDIITSYHSKTGILENRTMNNPAIFVPKLKKIIYGCQSWWREIESIEDFKGISKEDIENTLKLLHMEQSSTCCNDGWIACEDRLPEKSGYYEVTVQSIINNETIRTTEQRCYHKKEKYFASLINPEFNINEEVIAWRDMPEPYYQ